MARKEDGLSKFSESRKGIVAGVNSFKPKYIVIVFISVLLLTFLATYVAFSEVKKEGTPTCGDGTFYDTCSLEKPFYCEDGTLQERASLCGCPDSVSGFDVEKEGDFCLSEKNTDLKDISLRYILDGEIHETSFSVYEGVSDDVSEVSREISYEESEIPFRVDFKLRVINNEIQRQNTMPLVKKIQNLAPGNKADQARIALSMVQNVPYGFSNESINFRGEEVNYSRYPYEVLFDNQGICGEKSELAALLLKELGFGVSIFYFEEENHEAVGIKCPVKESLYGSGYCFVETGGPAIISDSRMEFVGGVKLESIPEVMLISEGISLPKGMEEYRDAKTLNQIRERNILGILKLWKHNQIREKYGLDGVYALD